MAKIEIIQGQRTMRLPFYRGLELQLVKLDVAYLEIHDRHLSFQIHLQSKYLIRDYLPMDFSSNRGTVFQRSNRNFCHQFFEYHDSKLSHSNGPLIKCYRSI